jgi:uncharacterized protein (TIGR02246 family)
VQAEEPAIHKVLDQFEAAWNRHDAAGLASLFAEDGDFVNVIGMWVQGRAAIAGVMERNHRTIFRESHLAQTGLAVRFPRPDVAVVHGTWDLTGERSWEDQPLPLREGRITMLMTREVEGWMIAAFQNTDIVEPPGRPAS